MTTFEHSTVIDRPIEEVWEFVADARNNPRWQGPIIEVRRGTGAPLAVGDEIEEVASFLGRRFTLTLQITELVAPSWSAVRTASGPVTLTGAYQLEEAAGGTRFSVRGDVEGSGFFALAEPVFARLARRELASSCDTLTELLHAQATTASS